MRWELFTSCLFAWVVTAYAQVSHCPADLSLLEQVEHFSGEIQQSVARLLEAQEEKCRDRFQGNEAGGSVAKAVVNLEDWIALYYRNFGVWHLPSQSDFWDTGAYAVAQMSQTVSESGILTQHNYTQLGRIVNDAMRVIFAVKHVAECYGEAQTRGLVVTFFMSNFPGLEHAQDVNQKAKFVAALELWNEKHCGSGSELNLHCMMVHDGLDEDILNAYGESFYFVHVDSLDGTRAKELKGQTLYEMRWAWGWTLLRDLDKYATVNGMSFEYVLFTDFTDVAFERDPFQWMAMTQSDYQVFMNEEVEGNVIWLLLVNKLCYGGDMLQWTSGTYYNAGLVGGKREELSDYVDMVVQLLSRRQKSESKDLKRFGCDMIALNKAAWNGMLRDKPRWRIFSGPPFAAPFRWSERPERNVWTRTGFKAYYTLHK